MGQPFPRVHLCGTYGHLPVIETAALLTTEVTGLFVPPSFTRLPQGFSHGRVPRRGEEVHQSLEGQAQNPIVIPAIMD